MLQVNLSERAELLADALTANARREFDAALAAVKAAAGPGVPADLWERLDEAATGLAVRTADSYLRVAFLGPGPRVKLRRV